MANAADHYNFALNAANNLNMSWDKRAAEAQAKGEPFEVPVTEVVAAAQIHAMLGIIRIIDEVSKGGNKIVLPGAAFGLPNGHRP